MQKSSIYFSPNANEVVIAEVCNTLGIQQTDDFGCYLGVPMINGRVTKATFQNVITRVEKRLAGLKAKCLSLAGWITMIQSTIAAIPANVMQSARLPRSVCDDLDKRIRIFLWRGNRHGKETSFGSLGYSYQGKGVRRTGNKKHATTKFSFYHEAKLEAEN